MASVKSRLAGLLLVVLMVGVSGISLDSEAATSKGKVKGMNSWVKNLKLSKVQRVELKKITSLHNKRIMSKKKALTKASASFKGSIGKKIPESEIRDRFKTMMDARGGLAKAKLDKALAMRKILTSEQMKVFRDR